MRPLQNFRSFFLAVLILGLTSLTGQTLPQSSPQEASTIPTATATASALPTAIAHNDSDKSHGLTPIEVIDKVNSFYSGAFTQLITLTIAVLGFGGVILPILVQIIQSRNFRSEQKSLEIQITSQLAAVKSEVLNEIEKKFDTERADSQKLLEEQMKTMQEKLDEVSHAGQGSAFFLQARFSVGQKKFAIAALSFALAGEHLLRAKDEMNAQRAITQLREDCLPQINKGSFEAVERLRRAIDDLLNLLQEKNENARYSDTIRDLKSAYEKAKNREALKPKPAESPEKQL